MTRVTWLLTICLWLAAAPPVPRPSPELAIRLPSGRQLLLSQYRGKVVALEFMYTTCPHCQNTAQVMNRLQKEYAARGFQALGVAFNGDAPASLPGFVKQFGIAYPVGLGTFAATFAYLNIPGQGAKLPLLVLIDRKGIIRAQLSGGDPFFLHEERNLRGAVESLLKERAPAGGR